MKATIMAALALLPVAAGVQAQDAAGVGQTPAAGTLLEVSAQGRSTRVPDLATIRAGVVTQAAAATAALADNAARMNRVVAALSRAGVPPRDVQTATVSLQPQYRYADGQPPAITGYQATNSVAVRLHDVARTGAVLDALVAEGANQIEGPNLAIDKPEAALDEARVDAVRRARARADLYAQAAGLHVVRILRIAEAGQDDGGSQPPRPLVFARIAAAAAPSPIAAGERDVGVTLDVRFLLQ